MNVFVWLCAVQMTRENNGPHAWPADRDACAVTLLACVLQEVNHLLKDNYMELTEVLDQSLEGKLPQKKTLHWVFIMMENDTVDDGFWN